MGWRLEESGRKYKLFHSKSADKKNELRLLVWQSQWSRIHSAANLPGFVCFRSEI